MPQLKNIIFAISILLCASSLCMATPKLSFIDKVLHWSDDVARLGKKAGKLAPTIRADMIKKYPRLAKAGDDLIHGVYNIEKATSKSVSAGKMIENGINPAKVATLTARSPKIIESGDKIAGIFATAKVQPQMISKLPPQAASALRKADRNYREAGEMFLQMERRGGTKAVDVAEKLSQYATLGNAAAATALGLLAWHMADPVGAEQAIEKFFQDHVAPIVTAPAKGILNAAGDATEEMLNATGDASQKVLKTATSRVGAIVIQYWPALLFLAFLFLLWRVPNMRKMPFIFLNNFFGRLNKKMATLPEPSTILQQKTPAEWQNGNQTQMKINVFKR